MEKWQDPEVIAFWIAIIVVFIVTLLFFVVRILHAGYKRMTEANLRENQLQLDHQKKLIETNLLAQEKERMRIAADLHDSLIGKLAVVRMKSQLGTAPQELSELLEESITEARRISHDLTPPLLEFSRAEELIEDVFNPWKEKLKIVFYKDIRNTPDLSVATKIQLIRVVQEILVNILKHANADTVFLHFRHTSKNLTLLIRDNGKGFDVSELKKGLGLNNLELRMQYLNAKYRINSGKGKGTTTLIVASAII